MRDSTARLAVTVIAGETPAITDRRWRAGKSKNTSRPSLTLT